MVSRNLFESFKYAIEGILYAIKSQRNMKLHVLAALVVIVSSLFFDLTRIEVMLLIFAVSLVLICELFNTAVEKAVDTATREYHPLAKLAKDVSAGAVLVAAINSIAIGYLVFFNKIEKNAPLVIDKIKACDSHIAIISIFLVLCLVLALKFLLHAKNVLRGGMPSGHAAVAFSLVTTVIYLSDNIFVSFIALILGILVVQSRIEAKIHNIMEIVIGALIGIFITSMLFYIF